MPGRSSSLAAVITAGSGFYAARHFAITTDVNKLISPELGWRQREIGFEKAYPGSFGSILVVVDAPTTELVAQAATQPGAAAVRAAQAVSIGAAPGWRSVLREERPVVSTGGRSGAHEPGAGTRGPDRRRAGRRSVAARPDAGALLRFPRRAERSGQARRSHARADHVRGHRGPGDGRTAGEFFLARAVVGAGPARQATFATSSKSCRCWTLPCCSPAGRRAPPSGKRRPTSSSEPDYQARIRLTGSVTMADDEFGTLQDGAVFNVVGTIIIVLIILWLALHSPRIILAVFLNLAVGFAVTAALGLIMVGALNLISMAFAVLFVGLGVDFGIQFAVRYRSERFKHGDLYSALGSTAEKVGAPLTLAAAAIAAGFLSFFPTDYKGVSELGQIAGLGMLIAYLTTITVLPALLTILHPPGEAEQIGYRLLAPVDRFLERRRIPVIGGTILVARRRIAAALLPHLRLQSDQPAKPRRRVGRDLPRSANRSEHRRQCDQCGAAELRQCRQGCRSASQDSGGRSCFDAAGLRAGRAGAQADVDPRARTAAPDAAQHRRFSASSERCADRRRIEGHRRHAHAAGRQGERAGRGCGQPPGREPDEARRRRQGEARHRRDGVHPAAARCADRAAGLPASRAGDVAKPARDFDAAMGRRGRANAGPGDAEGRSQRQRNAAPLRARHPGAVSGCGRRADFDPGVRQDHCQGFHPRRAALRWSRSRSCCGSCCGASATCC